jgi:hypothetical protein
MVLLGQRFTSCGGHMVLLGQHFASCGGHMVLLGHILHVRGIL